MAKTYDELLEACHKPFRWDEHQFIDGNIYVKIQHTVQRLNSLGVPWDLQQGDVHVELNSAKTKSGKDQYNAHCAVQLRIDTLGTRGAVGAATNFDLDTAVKSAHSYALRKAASLFGIAHYLMLRPVEETAFVNHMASADLGDVKALKRALSLVCAIEDIPVNPDTIQQRYGLDKSQQGNVESLVRVLKKEGRL